MNPIKIVTHGGIFHADEILAIASIRYFFGGYIPVQRFFQVEYLANPYIFVLDVGQKYQPELGNFDHHQDGNLPSTNVLVLKEFCKDLDLYNRLMKHLYGYVSDVDRGIISGDDVCKSSFNSIIRNYNALENGFAKALTFASEMLEAYIATSKTAIAMEGYYYSLERALGNRVIIERNQQFIPDWKEYAEKEDVLLMLSPNARGGWQLVSRDDKVLVIPPTYTQTFRHSSGFMAVYRSFDDALKHAAELVK